MYDPNAKDTLTFHIQSYALKKALGREVTINYMNTGIFTEFQRQTTEVVIKKTNNFNQINFLKSSKKKQQSDSDSKSGKVTAATSSKPTANDMGLGFCQDDDEIEDITAVETVVKRKTK